MVQNCVGKTPIYVYPSFHIEIKLVYSMDVDGVLQGGQITTELGISDLGQVVCILKLDNFRTVVDTK